MSTIKNIFASRWGIISVGAFIGVFAPLLQKRGNLGNLGISAWPVSRGTVRVPWAFTGPLLFNIFGPKSSALSLAH
jgi:hypothetical protein